MKSLTTETLLATLLRNALAVPACHNVPPRIVIRRLSAHLSHRCLSTTSRRYLHAQIQHGTNTFDGPSLHIPHEPLRRSLQQAPGLPQSCPGCGALTQESQPDQAGFYSRSRRVVKKYMRKQRSFARAVDGDGGEASEESIASTRDEQPPQDQEGSTSTSGIQTPVCDRCHNLTHNSRGHSIAHPTIDSIADSIAESPFKRNHIYHVIDAADFPMSLVPEIFTRLSLARPRSQNRRSQHDFSTKPTISFIITRSDLLGSTKEMVDGMMTYFQSVLRKALGRTGRDMRLGNIHLVSAKRGWWTKEIKEDVWKRGGANWMLGKVNVGKSNLFEVLFPKGSGERAPVYAELKQQQEKGEQNQADVEALGEEDLLAEDSLLPPAQVEVPFPVMPVVSSLPGTTASPIRLPFGGHKGELIDLPGLERSNLEDYVKSEHKLDLVMTHRHNVEQHIIKPGQSLILGGGLVRITPQLNTEDRSTTVLAYPFVPLKAHVTSTDKAVAQQLQQRESGVDSILEDGAGTHMASAGMFELDTDVTKARSGPLARAGVALSKLPFQVYATDILIEGVGWVELVCQIRRRRATQLISMDVAHESKGAFDEDPLAAEGIPTSEAGFAPFARQPPLEESELTMNVQFPRVEIFSPLGKHISRRPCIQAWTRWNEGGKGKRAMPLKRRR